MTHNAHLMSVIGASLMDGFTSVQVNELYDYSVFGVFMHAVMTAGTSDPHSQLTKWV